MRLLVWEEDAAGRNLGDRVRCTVRVFSAAEGVDEVVVGGPTRQGAPVMPGGSASEPERLDPGTADAPGLGDPLTALSGERKFGFLFAVGSSAGRRLASAASYRGRIVAWAPDLLDALAEPVSRPHVDDLIAACGAVLCDSEAQRSHVERRLPACRGRTVHWPDDPSPTLVRRLVNRLAPSAPAVLRGRRLRVLFTGHAFGFIDAVAARLARLAQCDVRMQQWPGFAKAKPAPANVAANDWADVVVCEWAGANAAWHSRHKHPGQRLIVRLHRFEWETAWPRAVDWSAVDQLVAVSPWYRDLLSSELPGVRAPRVVALPNYVDPLAFDRQKAPDSRFNLGMLGAVPKRKRPDLAFDLLAELRRHDSRYRLFVKTEMPKNRPAWRRRDERAYYRRLFRRARRDPALRHAVVFEPFGSDVGDWLRKIGTVLSTSDSEGSHVAVAEGMMSRATSVVLPWPGADGVYGDPWVVPDVCRAAEKILAWADPDLWDQHRQAARRHAKSYEFDRVFEAWATLLVADRDPAAWISGGTPQ